VAAVKNSVRSTYCAKSMRVVAGSVSTVAPFARSSLSEVTSTV
jgi:hypothetical protein